MKAIARKPELEANVIRSHFELDVTAALRYVVQKPLGDIREPLCKLAHGQEIRQREQLLNVPCFIMAPATERTWLAKRYLWWTTKKRSGK
jgi:hypothetical protein